MKTIGTCKDCKWLNKLHVEHEGNGKKHFHCGHKKVRYSARGKSAAVPHGNDFEMGHLACGPDFGCIHWEAIPIEKKLITIDENAKKMSDDRAAMHDVFAKLTPPHRLTPSGIICPGCGRELMWNQFMYGLGPMSRGVECECGLKGGICTFTGHFGRVNETTGGLMR